MSIADIAANTIQSCFVLIIAVFIMSILTAQDGITFNNPLVHCMSLFFYAMAVLVLAYWVWT